MSRQAAIEKFLQASKLMKNAEYTQAEELFESVMDELADVPALYYNLAQIHHQVGNGNKALKQLDEALMLDPNNINYLKLQSQVLQNLGLFKDAIDILDKIEEIEYHPDLVINKGFLYLRNDEIERAVNTFENLLQQGSNEAVVYFTLGILKYQGKELDEAEKLIREAIKQDYQTEEARNVLINILEQNNKMAEAIDELENIKIKTENNEFSLARIYKNEGRMEDALSKIDELLLKDEKNIDYLNFKGHTFREMGKHTNAVEMYDQVLAVDDDDLSAIKGKALCLVELDQHDEANELFERGEKLNRGGELPDFDDLVMNLDVL